MLVVIAYCAKDKATTVRLAHWIAELGGVEKHDCMLGVHTDTDTAGIYDVLKGAFKRVGSFLIDEEATVYPYIANMMWKRCVQHVADGMDESQPWLWLEPDAVPLVPSWLDDIETEYKAKGKPFLLDKVVTPTSVHNSGIGVYPARVRDYTTQLWNLANVPWDVFFKDDFTRHTHHTGLIHDKFYQTWDDPKSGPPVFPDAQSLEIIEPGAVIFHRNKDGSLMERLRDRPKAKPFIELVSVSVSGGSAFAEITPSEPMPQPYSSILSRIEALEAAVFHARINGSEASATAKSGDRVVEPALKLPTRARGKKPMKKRKPMSEEHKAKLRAAWEKRRLTGVA